MAKDPTTPKVSTPEGGTYESSEEVRKKLAEKAAEAEEILIRPEVINLFGEKIGQILIDGGYSTVASVINATDKELKALPGIGKASLAKIRALAPSADALAKEASQQPSGKEPPASVRIQRIRDSQR